jgi:hypothetical protein
MNQQPSGSDTAALEALFRHPSHEGPRVTVNGELRAAAKILHLRDKWETNSLMWWLVDTAMLHEQGADGACERDGDAWPCHDVRAARKVAETVRIMGPDLPE